MTEFSFLFLHLICWDMLFWLKLKYMKKIPLYIDMSLQKEAALSQPFQTIMYVHLWYYSKTQQGVVPYRLVIIWNLKIDQWTFHILLKLIDLSCTLNGSLAHACCVVFHWLFGKYWSTELCTSSKCWHILLYSIKNSPHLCRALNIMN